MSLVEDPTRFLHDEQYAKLSSLQQSNDWIHKSNIFFILVFTIKNNIRGNPHTNDKQIKFKGIFNVVARPLLLFRRDASSNLGLLCF